ncbi:MULTISPECIES: helix-turn-helix domain-containing protein [Rhodopirellula]|uniref:helix-turn-helix domain-containing protein n=1 Tax=Rhodopirellula TaxID=265488 RepID=UPI00257D9162|nr:helix-turn-helix domain-containing protein [Rhodopirellula sp. UBA1907]
MATNTPNFIVFTEEDYARLIDMIQQTIADSIPSRQPALPLFVKSAEMARLLSISEPHLDKMRREEIIPSTTIGRSRRYCPQQVMEALR